jgi:hypothetical protein
MDDESLIEEEKKMRRMRWIVDLTQAVLMQSDLSLHESLNLMNDTRKAVLSLFPDKAFVYDLIYTSRFQRILDERFSVDNSWPGRN